MLERMEFRSRLVHYLPDSGKKLAYHHHLNKEVSFLGKGGRLGVRNRISLNVVTLPGSLHLSKFSAGGGASKRDPRSQE